MVRKATWFKRCEDLETHIRSLINRFDDDCFYIAQVIEGNAGDCYYWKLETLSQKLIARYIEKYLWTENLRDMAIQCGHIKSYDLRKMLDSNLLALKMGAHVSACVFLERELDAADFPKLSEVCAKKHINWRKYLHHNYPDQKLRPIITDIFDLAEWHTEECVQESSNTFFCSF